ncbi:hypothetical protein CSB62_19810 [Vibrio splendidus]|nr:hypothetical protein CSB62_19810 [Vibrio splendidus]PME60790.1 hypothetical protein BCV33_05125 [Vibrio lentus]PMG61566.1 hypothetical protein BCU87_13815 [Vibrio lentus]PMI94821.1 hypothetical protein BCU33_15480 [Vibrio lentus]PMJ09567.1 hypothetical protein BCU31_15510 [Vibrio lentus]
MIKTKILTHLNTKVIIKLIVSKNVANIFNFQLKNQIPDCSKYRAHIIFVLIYCLGALLLEKCEK